MIASRLALVPKAAILQAARNSGGHHVSYRGSNLPFDIKNHRKLAIVMALYFGSAFWMPFLVLRFQMKKQ